MSRDNAYYQFYKNTPGGRDGKANEKAKNEGEHNKKEKEEGEENNEGMNTCCAKSVYRGSS